MSIFYSLHINTPLTPAEVERVIQAEHISHNTLNLDVCISPTRTVDIISSVFQFRPTLLIVYHLIPGNYDRSARAMLMTVVNLLVADQSDLVLLYNADTPILQRFQSSLILSANDFWNPELRALVPPPYSVEPLPHHDPRALSDMERELEIQAHSTTILASHGYRVTQQPGALANGRRPSYWIEDTIFDHYAPKTGNVHSIWEGVWEKIEAAQTRRIVLNLARSEASVEQLRDVFNQHPIDDLDEIILIAKNQTIVELYP